MAKTSVPATTALIRPAQTRPRLALRGWQADGLVFGLFVVLTVVLTWPVTPNMGRSLEQWGDALLQTWTLDWNAHAFLHDPLHFADSNAFYPYADSLAFTETMITQSVLAAPIIWLTDNPVLGYNLLLLSSFVLCGWGTYLLGRDLTGKRVAGIVAGLIFAFFPFRFVQFSHLNLLSTQWMPFTLLYLRRYLGEVSGQRSEGLGVGEVTIYPQGNPPGRNLQSTILNAFLFGLFLVLELLSSTYLGLFLLVIVGLYILWRLVGWLWQWRQRVVRWSWRGNRAIGLIVTLAVVGLIVTPFYLPFLRVQQALGFERSPAEVQNFSAQPFYYLDVPPQNKLNQALYGPFFRQGWWQGGGAERELYLGLGALLLTGLGVFVVWRWRKVRPDGLFFVLLAAVGIAFTFGPTWQTGRFGAVPLPYALLYNYVPGFAAIRAVVRFIYLVALAASVLAAFGIAWLQTRWQLDTARRAGLFAVILVVLFCGEYWSDVNQLQTDALQRPAPPSAQWLDAHPAPSLHVPLSGTGDLNLFIEYWARGSWRPVMNGSSGFMPPAYDALKAQVDQEGFSPRILELLQGLEVRYLEIETEDASIKPQWARLKGQLEKYGATVAAQFGGTFIYELKPDPWLRALQDKGVGPSSLTYWVEYQRQNKPLLELAVSYLERAGTLERSNEAGSISVGFRSLTPLPVGRPADFLMLPPAEDPTLYGFRSTDRVFANDLLAVYKKSSTLLARYDFTRQDTAQVLQRATPLTIRPAEDGLGFDNQTSGPTDRTVVLGLGVLEPQTLTIRRAGQPDQQVKLAPGFSTYRLLLDSGLTLSGGKFSLAWVELWQGTDAPDAAPHLRPNVVLLSSAAHEENGQAVADVQVVGPGTNQNYAATLDVYNWPSGTHPQGHYGYWSLPLPAGQAAATSWRLDLTHKTVTTTLNGQPVPNYPPAPADLDITKYGNLGDFRASLNVYTGSTLIGSAKLFDFTVWTQGDKNRLENRHASAFKGYNTAVTLLVLP